MTNRASTLVLLAFATISTGCGGDRAVGPLIDPPVLTSVELSPASVVLFPGFTQQLALAAFDQRRGHLLVPSHAVTYSSSNPAVAIVSTSGRITALSAGTAEIAATLNLKGVTQRGIVTTTVRERPFWSGTFQLNAPITSFDESFGDLTGWSFTARLTFWPDSAVAGMSGERIAGAVTEFRMIRADGKVEIEDIGLVRGSIDSAGRLVLFLDSESMAWAGLDWRGVVLSTTEPDAFEGTFAAGHQITGEFTARRTGN